MGEKERVLQECFNILDGEFGDKLTDEQRLIKKDLFKRIIGQYNPDQIKKMTLVLVTSRKYNSFPKISEMIEAMGGDVEAEIQEAWLYLIEKVQKFGYYKSVSFEEYPAVGGFINYMGGWIEFLEKMDEDDLTWVKKDFEKLYPVFKKRDNPIHFAGYFEIENNRKGYNELTMRELGLNIEGSKLENIKKLGGDNKVEENGLENIKWGGDNERKQIENKTEKWLTKEG